MLEHCKCGQRYDLDFRLVDYKKHVSIDNVPVLVCPKCEYEEVLPWVRKDLTALLQKLSLCEEPYGIDYTDFNELACIIYVIFTCSPADTKDALKAEIQESCTARINTLLDLYRCAKDAGDRSWMTEIEARLSQLSEKVYIDGQEVRYSSV
ncbi:hypothetical protein [Saccharibacillus kuerlensis]|uniref:YgiT-type zinc finger domain-containing protein n=1 Tax=Saccharibacillus kuerlensis TaxID=459527 RepID=A0ABQ2KZK3_9BACL|nr:hypothetical protein [Saccharibacillus kuerlensis]GGN96118.1 hypothetical protein GCM10010969_12730 [Saccharibacillus kuerlensis]